MALRPCFKRQLSDLCVQIGIWFCFDAEIQDERLFSKINLTVGLTINTENGLSYFYIITWIEAITVLPRHNGQNCRSRSKILN